MLATLLISDTLLASSCVSRTQAEHYDNATHVLIMKVVSTDSLVQMKADIPYHKVYFTNLQTIKGSYKSTYLNNLSNNILNPQMRKNEEYVAFLNDEGDTSVCSGTFKLVNGNLWFDPKLAEIKALQATRVNLPR